MAFASSRPVQGTVFNVKTYGAIGDGVADDTVAIQSAINACNAAGGSAPSGVVTNNLP